MAVTHYLASQDEATESTEPEGDDPTKPSEGAGRTLDGRTVLQTIPTVSAQPTSSSSSSKQPSRKKFATLGDLGGGGAGAHGGHDDDDDDDEEDQDFFAGGEKSALAVQNPDELKRKIIEKARK